VTLLAGLQDSFEYAINIAKSPLAIIAHKDSPVNTPQELIRLLETTNRNINFAVGSSSHKLAFEYLINNTKSRKHQILTANYKGPNQAGQDVAGGHVEFGVIPAAIAYQFYKAGKVKIIGLCGEKRLDLIPNVPLMEKYVPGLNVYAGWGILLPKNTPKEVVEWYNREFKKAITSKQAQEFFKQNLMFVEERELTPDGYHASMLVLRHRWQPIMTQRILIMGLPGAGKTMLAGALKKYLETHGDISYGRALSEHIGNLNAKVTWFNADDIRRKYNDWDFSNDGRIRQSLRMFQFSIEAGGEYVICDFVAPLVEMRNNFKADWTIWVDTIREGRYADTNAAFVEPDVYDFRVTEQNAEKWAEFIGSHIIDQSSSSYI
jgi:adenylylsulfate kinase